MSKPGQDHSSPLYHHEAIPYPIRRGDYLDHQTSTYALAENAVRDGRFDDAVELGRYTVREAIEAHELFRDWIVEISDYLRANGVDDTTLKAEAERLAALLKLPDGVSFDPEAGWNAYVATIEAFACACTAGRKESALTLLESAWDTWRDTHDRKCDWVYGLIDVAARRLGETCVGPLWDRLLAPMYEYYVRYDIDNYPWPRSFDLLMQYALEAIRGHLSGPGRRGDIEVFEEQDRWGIRFAPCGSGGRTLRGGGDADPPRMEPPSGFGVTTEAHDWAWNKKGVCLYCVHCCALNEITPIKQFGYPTRVVEPPTWPAAKGQGQCTWYIYKDPALIPDSIYQRVGYRKPAKLGGRAQRAAAHNNPTSSEQGPNGGNSSGA